MSERPNYTESWRPPPQQQRDSWRPSAEQPDFGTDRPWTKSRESHEEEDRLSGVGRKLPAMGDPWRPPRQEGRNSTKREGDLDQQKEDSASQTSSYRSPRSPPQTFNLPIRPAGPASGSAQSNLNPSVSVFQPGDVRQYSSFNHAAPMPLRSANSLSTATSRNGGDNLNTLIQSAARSHRHSLRSRPPDAVQLRTIKDANISPGQLVNIHARNGFGPSIRLNALQRRPEHEQTTPQRVRPPPAPTATELYLAQARLPAIRCAAPKKLLVVLDLNGTLLVRPNRMKPRDFNIRPGVHQLLDYLFDNHVVMVYSSARPENVEAMVDALVSKKRARSIAAVWGRDKLELTPAQYNEKVQVYKKLEKVWEDERIQATCLGKQRWNQTNTVLVDDSHLKALSQPHNLIQVSEFTKKKQNKKEKRIEHEVVASVRAKLEELKWAHDVSRHILCWQTGQMEPPHATKLSPLPKFAGGNTDVQPSQADDTISDTDESVGGADIQAELEEDMQNLTTNPSARDESHRMDEPAISADEWKEFLK